MRIALWFKGESREAKAVRFNNQSRYWHRRFAWLPRVIPEQKHDSIVVPRLLIWLEPYERRGMGITRTWWHEFEIPSNWEYRVYVDAPELCKVKT